MSTIGERLRELRRALGLKQREMGERLGLPSSSIGGWECGSYPIPKVRIYQLCNEYRVNREWLESGVGEMFVPETPSEVKVAETALKDAAISLFLELSPKGQTAVLQAVRDYLKEHGIEIPTGSSWIDSN